MLWKKKHLKTGLLYVILDKEVIDKNRLNIFTLADRLAKAGVDILQFRFKNIVDRVALDIAQRLSKIIHKKGKIFIINDRVDIAYIAKADGVHLGRDDVDTKTAKSILGKNKFIGKTAHTKKELLTFAKEDVDYLSIGAVFKTKTKPKSKPLGVKFIKAVTPLADKPLFAIGGINLRNVSYLFKIDIKNIAVCRGVILSKNIPKTVSEFKRCLKEVS